MVHTWWFFAVMLALFMATAVMDAISSRKQEYYNGFETTKALQDQWQDFSLTRYVILHAAWIGAAILLNFVPVFDHMAWVLFPPVTVLHFAIYFHNLHKQRNARKRQNEYLDALQQFESNIPERTPDERHDWFVNNHLESVRKLGKDGGKKVWRTWIPLFKWMYAELPETATVDFGGADLDIERRIAKFAFNRNFPA